MAKALKEIPLSVLNLVNYTEGHNIADAFTNAADLARLVEEWGYKRYWMAEHHNLEGIASSSTAVLIGYIASQTKKFEWVRAASCCPTIRRSSLPKPLEL